jgi:RimJ/RimL family protein N-acetyltransferase
MAFPNKMIPPPTSRLCFRFFEKDDLPLVEQLNSNPDVTYYLGGVSNRDEVELSFQRYLKYHHQHPGYGYWCTVLNSPQVFVGWFIVKLLPETGETEIGYRLLPEFWGRGLATEGALSMVNYALEELKLTNVVGVAAPGNIASRRVLEKAGLTFRKYGRYYQTQCAYYSLNLNQ